MDALEHLNKDILTDLKLPSNCTIHFFQGQHRLAAATEWLSPDELWWILYLYDSTKLTAEARRKLQEVGCSSQEFNDGDIYHNAWYYQQQGEPEPAGEWLARWTPTKCRDFKQIYDPKVDSHRNFCESLDAFLVFPALWSPWLMGTHLLSLRCPEVWIWFLWEVSHGADNIRSLLITSRVFTLHGFILHANILICWTPILLSFWRDNVLVYQKQTAVTLMTSLIRIWHSPMQQILTLACSYDWQH